VKTHKLMPPSFTNGFHTIALVHLRMRKETKQGALPKKVWACLLAFTCRSTFCSHHVDWLGFIGSLTADREPVCG
jgi:hypothetical protein